MKYPNLIVYSLNEEEVRGLLSPRPAGPTPYFKQLCKRQSDWLQSVPPTFYYACDLHRQATLYMYLAKVSIILESEDDKHLSLAIITFDSSQLHVPRLATSRPLHNHCPTGRWLKLETDHWVAKLQEVNLSNIETNRMRI